MTVNRASIGYDVVILGGGVAGCVLAARLSEDPRRSVCLVEAGPDPGAQWRAWPAKVLNARALPRDDIWERHSEVHRIRGRILGGSSCINGCWNTWGSRVDHEEWSRLGGPQWSAAALQPYRQKAVGQMRLRSVPDDELSLWSRSALAAAEDIGYSNVDMSTPGPPGFGTPLINAIEGVRWNAAFAYLGEARSRPNLSIICDATAVRMDVRSGRIRSVEIDVSGRRETLASDRYVVSSGTFGSPTLLMRSGIGPADHLQDMGIRPQIDVPGVGDNLVDQPGVFVPLPATAHLTAALAAKEQSKQLYVSRMLIRAASGLCPENAWDLHILPSAGPPLFGKLPAGEYEAGVSAFLMKPASRGRVRLRSAEHTTPPDIQPAFLSDPDGHDIAVLRSGLAIVHQLIASPAIRTLIDPAPATFGQDLSDEQLRESLGTYWHPVGTCAMGPPEDPSVVVDGSALVRGTENLWVVDASILPTVPAANTQLPVLAVAEMLADTLRS